MDDWNRVQRLFLSAADMATEEQASFLDSECAGDEELRREIEELFLGDRDAAETLTSVVEIEAARLIDVPMMPGERVGAYRAVSEIGRGGMGVVYLATRDDDQFQKRVAIKIVSLATDTPGMLHRFRHERQILANLEHPSIARLLDGGTTPDGRPWIAMEYVEGLPIDRFCLEQNLTVEERCRLICQVCDAVAYAHCHLVVHRDLKPSNILITADGSPKLLDFGIAKLLGEDELGESPAATPEYASPEQIRGAPVTTASDVYSLGVVLHEVLTGVRPGAAGGLGLTAPDGRGSESDRREDWGIGGAAGARLAGDLYSIVGMALREDAGRRYRSAEQLALDLRRYLDGLPVLARRNTLIYRTGKFLGRNRMAVGAGFLVAASIVTGAVIDLREAIATRARFNQLRGFARTVLVDLHGQLGDIPGTAKARQALVTYVDEYLKQVVAQKAGDDTALATEFATTYLRLGEMQGATPEALASFESGRRLLERPNLSAADSLMLARLRLRAGSTLLDLGRTDEGVENLKAAVALANGKNKGTYPEADLVRATVSWRLARLYRLQYRLAEAEQQARAAIATGEEIVQRGFPSKEVYRILTGSGNVLGAVERRQGHWQESMATYQKVLADTEQRALAEPGSASLQREMARSHQILADMVVRVPVHDENLVRFHLRSAIRIAERLAALDPWDKTAQSELAQYLSSGAEELLHPEDDKETLGYLRRAMPIFETLLKSEPANRDLQLYAALTEADMGEHLGRRKSSAESIAWLRRGIADLQALVEMNRNTTNVLELIKVQEWLSLSLAKAGRKAEALEVVEGAVANARFLADQGRGAPESRRELPRAYAAVGMIYDVLGQRSEARKSYRSATVEWEKMISQGLHFPDSEQEIEDARKGASTGGTAAVIH